MTVANKHIPELYELAGARCEGELTAEQAARLEQLVLGDAELRRLYVLYMHVHACAEQRGSVEAGNDGLGNLEIWKCGDVEISGVRDSGLGVRDFHVPNPKSQIPNQQIPSLSTLHSPLSTNFVGGPVFSYIAATLILGVMLLGAWAYKITHDYGTSYVHNSRGLTAPGEPAQRSDPIFVARVTGTKDCRWADPATETYAGAFVPLGRKYALSSGLMEITYRSGAKVILEGPCRYEVESAAGGFLALGKLTARVEKRSEVGGQRSEAGGQRSEVRGQRSEAGGQRSEAGGLAASAASMMPQTSNLPSPNGRGVGGEGNGNQKQSALTLTLSQRERGPDSSPKPQALSPKPQAPSPKPQDQSPKPQISQSPNHQISKSLFAVRTPTALVTDLGTEFGVEVAANGDTASHVFQGSIQVRAIRGLAASDSRGLAASAASDAGITLAAGQSARVEKDLQTGEARITTGQQAGAAPRFVRRMYEPPKYLDLLDIVAGGNGLGNRRETGIHPIGGYPEPIFVGEHRSGENRFNLVNWSRFIDGVFVPDGRAGPVRLDSAGHAFDGFPKTTGVTYGPIWARTAKSNPSERGNDPAHWIFLIGDCRQFTPEGRGLLGMCPNVGITFDLQAVRGMLRDARPGRLRATAGVADARFKYPDADGLADLWVFLDGRPRLKRMGLRPEDGPIDVDVAIGPRDRYLTLAVTDGGNGDRCDWFVVGDPALEIVSTEDEE